MTVATHTTYFAAQMDGDHCVIERRRDGEEIYLVAGPDPIAQQWTAWYSDVLRREQKQDWVDTGLRIFKSTWPGTSRCSGRIEFLYLWRGLPVGKVFWNGVEWMWQNLEHWGHGYGGGVHISVDPAAQLAFQHQREAIAREPDHLHASLRAELNGRMAAFRDETADLAVLWGKSRALRAGRAYDASGITYRCTGYYDQDGGFLDHQGESCQVHESAVATEPCPYCKATGSRFYNGEADAICRDCDGTGHRRVEP